MIKFYSVLCGLLLLSLPLQAETTALSEFSIDGLSGWTEKRFYGQTQYSITELNGDTVLLAESNNSASALYKKKRINLKKTPYLNWSWLVLKHLGDINERQKEGDDYPARIYVLISGGTFLWKTRVLNYVWSSNQPAGSIWPNAYSNNARMIALQSGSDFIGQWRTEKRNVRDDLRQQFGEDLWYIDGIAVMTDTDNSHGKAFSYYGDLFFSSD